MKIRTGFVSNSSSSSFIVIETGYNELEGQRKDQVVEIGQYGETEYGWEIDEYSDFYSKANFCYIQSTYVNEDTKGEWQSMLRRVIQEHTGAAVVEFNFVYDKYGLQAYIDHQSNAGEGENTEMFNSEESLRNFLFNPNSYIHTDNDNHD